MMGESYANGGELYLFWEFKTFFFVPLVNNSDFSRIIYLANDKVKISK